MDYARHVPSDQVYQAIAFSQLGAVQIEQMRHDLTCPECNNAAFYRKATKHGHAACFGARHIDGCGMATAPRDRIEDGLGANEDALENPGQHILVDLNFGAAEQVNADAVDADARGRGRVRHFDGDGERPPARAHRRLGPLLRNLIEIPGYAHSHRVIEAPGSDPMPAHTFFVNFENFADAHLGEFRGYWGTIDNTRRRDADGLYLNTGGRDALSILVPNNILPAFYGRYNVNNGQSFRGAQVLVLGTPWRTISGKKLCAVASENHIAAVLPA